MKNPVTNSVTGLSYLYRILINASLKTKCLMQKVQFRGMRIFQNWSLLWVNEDFEKFA